MSMLWGLLLVCACLVLYAFGLIYNKMQIAQMYKVKRQQRKRKKPAAIQPKSQQSNDVKTLFVEEYEQQLFDDAATLFMHQSHSNCIQKEQAADLQAELLKKMPAQTLTYVRELDLAEWSIYWTFFDQSLECYIGCYGLFFTHVDRNGVEHKHIVSFESDHS